MATHCSTLAWKIPWVVEPGGLQSMGSLSPRLAKQAELHNWSPHTWDFLGCLGLGSSAALVLRFRGS